MVPVVVERFGKPQEQYEKEVFEVVRDYECRRLAMVAKHGELEQ